MKVRKIFLTYGYSQKNAGDLAITLGALDLLLTDKKNEITILSRYNKSSSEFIDSVAYYNSRYGQKVKILPAPFVLDRAHSKLKLVLYHLLGVFTLIGLKRANYVRDAIKDSDIVIFNGGNLLRSSSALDFFRLNALYYPLRLAKKYGKEYIIFPQSSAHINSLGNILIKEMLTNAKTAFIREQFSYKKLVDKYKLSNLVQTIDLAFFINKGSLNQYRINTNKKVAFTFRAHSVGDIYEMPAQEKEKIFQSISKIIAGFETAVQIVFVVQTRKDLEFSISLKDKLEMANEVNIEIFENYDPADLIDFYSSIDLLVGMRLHSIILAASVGTPCYGVFYEEWGLKNPGLMDKLQMPYIMIDGNDAVDKINTSDINSLMEDKERFTDFMHSVIDEELVKFKKVLAGN